MAVVILCPSVYGSAIATISSNAITSNAITFDAITFEVITFEVITSNAITFEVITADAIAAHRISINLRHNQNWAGGEVNHAIGDTIGSTFLG